MFASKQNSTERYATIERIIENTAAQLDSLDTLCTDAIISEDKKTIKFIQLFDVLFWVSLEFLKNNNYFQKQRKSLLLKILYRENITIKNERFRESSPFRPSYRSSTACSERRSQQKSEAVVTGLSQIPQEITNSWKIELGVFWKKYVSQSWPKYSWVFWRFPLCLWVDACNRHLFK